MHCLAADEQQGPVNAVQQTIGHASIEHARRAGATMACHGNQLYRPLLLV
jgi:hypothetical protein